MNKFTFLCLLIFMGQIHNLNAQSFSVPTLELESRGYASLQSDLPFWLWANQKGRISEKGKFHQLDLLKFNGSVSNFPKNVKINYGVSLVSEATAGSIPGIQLNEAFLRVIYKKAFLKLGSQSAEMQFDGLSATNGDFYYSDNSRPYPSIQLGTNGFFPLFKNVSFSALYEEALIRDKYEYIQNPNLHHKNFFLRWGTPEKIRITAGLDDYAWWGGTSPNPEYGKLPSGFKDYLRIVLCQPGGPTAPWTERDNAAGNHLGQYVITVEKEINHQSLIFYLNHPIEDRSGNKWQNYQDNLYGLFWKSNQPQTLVSSALFEFYFTRNQNIHPTNSTVPPEGQGPVNYFNHGVYLSGYTYKGNVIGVPLFYPVVYDINGKLIGIENTRFFAFHGGVGGSIVPRDHFKMMLTYSVNSGIWNSYPGKLKRLSSLFEYSYAWNRNIGINCGIAHDYTRRDGTNKHNIGGYFGVGWKILP